MKLPWTGLEFGLGLLEIGRAWGFRPSPVPDDEQVAEFLRGAYEAGVRIFDTAPSYAWSEPRFGAFLGRLTAEQRDSLIVATKFGESWDFDANQPVLDHSYDALMHSLEESFRRLGRIDILQVHRSTPEVLRAPGTIRALEAAKAAGIRVVGASVKDLESVEIACTNDLFQILQIPYNRRNQAMRPAVERARAAGRLLFTNRPFAEGELLQAGDRSAAIRACFAAIRETPFDGAILAGTRSVEHLKQNLAAFQG
ncbi:aldo/keto reductase [uncultured Paludibaculum sp.]|uniref:aldo/keto reductase n=1 Tax=uncultured Paludibaculum sp. TaxID=1765020 RepID=UPI002AAAFDF8|nr:aldo/keto reductase [uncultured Paludibaculum sp.]